MTSEFSTKLNLLLENKAYKVPAWLEDLLLAGPRLEQWPPKTTYPPNRVILTEFLANWIKYAGVPEDECLAWLDLYALEVLAQYSKSGRSAIRHGTKANTRWVYKCQLRFDFDAMAQEPIESGFENSPPFMSMFAKWHVLLYKEKQRIRDEYVPPVFVPVLPKKQRFKEQFEKAVAIARQKRREGMKPGKIVAFLNEQGWLTSTGRKWTLTNLNTHTRNPWGLPEPQGETESEQPILPEETQPGGAEELPGQS